MRLSSNRCTATAYGALAEDHQDAQRRTAALWEANARGGHALSCDLASEPISLLALAAMDDEFTNWKRQPL